MSFGYSVIDVISLTRTAWNVVQNSRKACGEHDELTREVLSLHVVLKRLEHEAAKPDSPMNQPGHSYGEELGFIAGGCHRVLRVLDQILEKYSALSEVERSGRKLWQNIKFGNGEMADLADYRSKVVYYTSAISLWLNMISIGTMGSVEKQMNDAGGDLKEIKEALNGITAHLIAKDHSEGSVLTTYPDDDKLIWKEFRRELIADGFSSSVIGKHKDLIKAYIGELGARGLLDDADPQAMNEPTAQDPPFIEKASLLVASKKLGKDRCIQTTTKTSPDPPRDLAEQSSASPSSNIDSLSKNQSVTSVTETEEEIDSTGHNETTDYMPDTGNVFTVIENCLSGNSEDAHANVEAAVQATTSVKQNTDSFLDKAIPDSPADMIEVVFNAWFNEYLLTTQYPNIDPSLGVTKTLRNLLLKLNAANLEAIGWSSELKACRSSLIKQLNFRLNMLDRRSRTLRKHHFCRPRCFFGLNSMDNAKTIRDTERKLLGFSTDTHDGAPQKNSASWPSMAKRHLAPGALHRIWHDHHDRIAPLCMEWVELWAGMVWGQGKYQKNVNLMQYIDSMRRNKELLEPLDFCGDAELTACRRQLMDDIKMMVSSMRIFKSIIGWKWETRDLRTKSKGQRLFIDISWLKRTIVCSLGRKCKFCSPS